MVEDGRVCSILPGVVVTAGARGGLGNAVEIYHPGPDARTIYGHLNEVAVKAGEKVAGGEVIGYAGETGHATGVHLHFEVRTASNITVEPLAFLKRNGVSPFPVDLATERQMAQEGRTIQAATSSNAAASES